MALWAGTKGKLRNTALSTKLMLDEFLVLLKSFEDITFDFVPGLHHTIGFLLPPFTHARFKAIGAVGNGMGCDGIQQLFIDAPAYPAWRQSMRLRSFLSDNCAFCAHLFDRCSFGFRNSDFGFAASPR